MHVADDSEEYDYMWDKLAGLNMNRRYSVPQMCTNKEEVWQYMGTYQRKSKIVHEFRHRCHPCNGQRIYTHIEASPEYVASIID